MSRYDWESGSLTLPAAAVPALKKTLRDWTNALHADIRAEAVRLHKDIAKSTRSTDLYAQRIADHTTAQHRSPASYARTDARTDLVRALAANVIDDMLRTARADSTAPHQPTLADVAARAPKATNRTDTFHVLDTEGYYAATIRFDGRTVHWSTGENNHQVERAHSSPLAQAFFTALSKVAWTRGTGGHFIGNDEYHRDSQEAGGGGNYVTSRFGPLGDAQQIQEWRRAGFSKTQAEKMLADSKRPARGLYGRAW